MPKQSLPAFGKIWFNGVPLQRMVAGNPSAAAEIELYQNVQNDPSSWVNGVVHQIPANDNAFVINNPNNPVGVESKSHHDMQVST